MMLLMGKYIVRRLRENVHDIIREYKILQVLLKDDKVNNLTYLGKSLMQDFQKKIIFIYVCIDPI
jgi:hypothetical protein